MQRHRLRWGLRRGWWGGVRCLVMLPPAAARAPRCAASLSLPILLVFHAGLFLYETLLLAVLTGAVPPGDRLTAVPCLGVRCIVVYLHTYIAR